MSNTADSSPRGSNSPSPYPYQGRPIDNALGPSSRPSLIDAEMNVQDENRSASPADFLSRTHHHHHHHHHTTIPRPPTSPSSTSQSDDGGPPEDFADLASVEDFHTKTNPGRNFDPAAVRLSRRGTLIPASPSKGLLQANAPLSTASNLPHEILLHIFKYLVLYPPDLLNCLLVCKSWCLNGVELLWHRPALFKISSLFKLVGVIRKPEQLFPYPHFVRRLNFTLLANQLEDQLFLIMSACTRLERLTLAGCANITDATLVKVFQNTPQLVAIDLTDVVDLSDATLITLARNCPKAQGINLTGCKKITSKGVAQLANSCKLLRRVKLCGCDNVDDEALISLTQNCPALLEVDLIHCPKISDKSVGEIWQRSYQMREFRLAHCTQLTDNAFPSARRTTALPMLATSHSARLAGASGDGAETSNRASPGAQVFIGARDNGLTRTLSVPSELGHSRMFDHLRILDLTSCTSISDDAVEGIIANVPRLKNLALTKCTRLTDESLYSIAKLGKNLHYLHLGHVSNITDRAVTHLARSCTRLRYIDVACCPNLTDLSVTEIAHNMPKLRRIGLVKVINLTDQAIYGLVDRYNSLERIHLSYCENVSVPAIFCVLQRLPRLTHLSLTGVPAFRRAELQAFCRQPPKDFNDHQRQAFCVYSGKGVADLRKFLQRVYSDEHLAVQFGQLEPRARTALEELAGVNANGNAEAMNAGGRVQVVIPAPPGTGPQRRQLTRAEQLYYDQQRHLAHHANARRAAHDTALLNGPLLTDAARRQALVDAQEQRNPGLPLIGQERIPWNAAATDAGIAMMQDVPHADQGVEMYGTPDASQDLSAPRHEQQPALWPPEAQQ